LLKHLKDRKIRRKWRKTTYLRMRREDDAWFSSGREQK
jgi:hypothetical protein